ncbi:hypothetical protein Golob_009613, partial [Gossypium lobatum]|nr:hypothetical protein [Gossypium lobatum]
MFLQYGISGVSALEPSFHRLVFLLRLKLQDTMNRIHAWQAVAPPHQKISASCSIAVAVRLITVAVILDTVAVRFKTAVECVFGFKCSCSGG